MFDNKKKNIIYRVDGGRVWGVSMGHVKRALISAAKLSRLYNIIFVMKDYSDGVQYVEDAGFFVKTIDQEDDTDKTLINLVENFKPEKVIFDLKLTPYKEFFSYARKKNIETIVFDILGKCAGRPDIIINDSFVPEFTSYTTTSSGTKTYIGPQYFLSDGMPKAPQINEKLTNVAVTMGGSDPAGLTKKIVESLIKLNIQKTFTIILGPLFPKKEEEYIRSICNGEKFTIHRNPANFLDILAGQDLVISAGGRTLYECSYLGRPTIVVPSIEHEEKTARKYNELTGCHNLGLWTSASKNKIHKAISKYEDFGFRKRINILSRSLVDNKSCDRIMAILV